MANKKYRILEGYGPISLRKSPDPKSELYEEWFDWRDGDVFEPPAHLKSIAGMSLDECVTWGMLEEVKGNG
jgi:hypothetical protein